MLRETLSSRWSVKRCYTVVWLIGVVTLNPEGESVGLSHVFAESTLT
jgi:hypothetical protein